jgi:hypothetical protein
MTLTPHGRIMLGCGILCWGVVGLVAANSIEDAIGIRSKREDEEKLQKVLPKIRVIDRRNTPTESQKGD